ncbi:hypothetical protein EYC80_010584 [Monilinia laxa]|uniref:Uncharacterized protein n=1 Tax=Monilinia laxa TaxID=61186 RepID=A0A5N6JMS3_MONLA|nr:hypothetical protein EYC80_010584 [Monilinia laxa]
MILRRKKRIEQEEELYRLHQSMHSAMEDLRLLEGAGQKDAGRLYRVALEKKGIFGNGGIPIEQKINLISPCKDLHVYIGMEGRGT